MDKLKRKGEALAEAKVQKAKAALKAVLFDELLHDISVEDTEEGVVVSGCQLGNKMVDNSSLRDVAFLMRGVK